MWLERDGNPASFWHDIPTYPDESNPSVINFVVEIPRWTSGKIEINREEPLSKSTWSVTSIMPSERRSDILDL